MSRENKMLPTSRPTAEFLVEEVASEVLIYDLITKRAHCLTQDAALVWRSCDGKTLYDDARAVLVANGARESLETILAQLTTAGFFIGAPPRRPPAKMNPSRRAMIGKTAIIAGAVLASPVIYSIVAPSVADAASVVCGTPPNPCCSGNMCSVGTCIAGTCQ